MNPKPMYISLILALFVALATKSLVLTCIGAVIGWGVGILVLKSAKPKQ